MSSGDLDSWVFDSLDPNGPHLSDHRRRQSGDVAVAEEVQLPERETHRFVDSVNVTVVELTQEHDPQRGGRSLCQFVE